MPPAPAPTHCEHIGIAVAQLKPGDAIPIHARRTVSDFDNIVLSLLAMNTHPAHTDYAYAQDSQFGKPLVVSPFLLSSLIAFVTNELRDVAITGYEIRALSFGIAVHPGDTITAAATVEEASADRLVLAVTGSKAPGNEFARFQLLLNIKPPQS